MNKFFRSKIFLYSIIFNQSCGELFLAFLEAFPYARSNPVHVSLKCFSSYNTESCVCHQHRNKEVEFIDKKLYLLNLQNYLGPIETGWKIQIYYFVKISKEVNRGCYAF